MTPRILELMRHQVIEDTLVLVSVLSDETLDLSEFRTRMEILRGSVNSMSMAEAALRERLLVERRTHAMSRPKPGHSPEAVRDPAHTRAADDLSW